MKKHARLCFVSSLLLVVVAGLAFALSGCSSNSGSATDTSSQPSETATASASSESTEPSTESPAQETASSDSLPPQAIPVVDEVPEASTEPVLYAISWTRDGGGENFCDEMVIMPDGSVTATVCLSGQSRGSYEGTLTEEQLNQLDSWLARFAPFSRHEGEVSNAVRSTSFEGKGSEVPVLADKHEIATFTSDIFFELTGVQKPSM